MWGSAAAENMALHYYTSQQWEESPPTQASELTGPQLLVGAEFIRSPALAAHLGNRNENLKYRCCKSVSRQNTRPRTGWFVIIVEECKIRLQGGPSLS